MKETVKNYLRIFYTSGDQKEATDFFDRLIHSETECSDLFNILIDIFLQDEDENLKKISLIIIREMNCDFILEAIFSLIQKSDPHFFYMIEILAENIAKQKNEELIPTINDLLSSTKDIFSHTAILLLLNSLKSNIERKSAQITDFQSIQKEYYEYFLQVTKTIIESSSQPLINFYYLFYFGGFFFNTMLELNDIEFFHEFSTFCLSQNQDDEINKNLIEIIVNIFPSFYEKNNEIAKDLIVSLLEYCESTNFIPDRTIIIWPYLVKNEENFLDYNSIILNYIFNYFKFEPDLMINNQELFLDEFDPDPDSEGVLPLQVFIYLMNKFSVEGEFIECIGQFVESYYQEFISNDSNEICRLFNFYSVLARPNNLYTIDFFQNKILPLIDSIMNNGNVDIPLIIGICQLIKNICKFIDIENNQEFVSMIDDFVNFLRWVIFTDFDVHEKITNLIFYFGINSITSLSKKFSINLFNFDEDEVTNIFIKVSQIYSEIFNESLTITFNYLVKIVPLDTDIEGFVSMIWDFIIQHQEKDLLDNFFILISNFFDACYDIEEKETVFNTFFSLASNEENKDFLIAKCLTNVVELFVLFTKEILDDAEKVPFFMESVGGFIFEMIMCVDSDLLPDFLNDESALVAKNEFQSLVNEYDYFCLYIIDLINDPNMCLELCIKPFMIPIIEKVEELNQLNNFDNFSFVALNAPLIKFRGDDDVFQYLFEFYDVFIQMQSFDDSSKIYLFASLIISKPSFLFENFDKDQFLKIINDDFEQLPGDIILFEITEILVFLSSNENEFSECISIIDEFFGEFLNKIDYDKDKAVEQLCLNTSLLYTYSFYNEDFNDVILNIIDILSKYE